MNNCEWREKIGLYVDGELEPSAEQALAGHLSACTDCSTLVLEQQEMKKAVRMAAKRFTAPPDLYASVRKQLAPKKTITPWQGWFAIAASTALLLVVAFFWYLRPAAADATVAQLVDQHVTMLASANPVDVVSTDRHTVKPWFQGKVPFTFNLPELKTSDFTLLGGKLVYAQQSPGAELVYQVRQHKLSVFIFQRGGFHGSVRVSGQAFTVRAWEQGSLQYYLVTDAAGDDADRLRALLEEANRQ